jgi:zinc protease
VEQVMKFKIGFLFLLTQIHMNAKINTFQKTLNNGLTVIVHPVDTTQKVAVELWYNVGSKDEKSGERGLAHLLEHMLFKGTEKLSETDYQAIVHKLSGDCNAHTSFDCTAYEFNVPVHNWRQTLPILADCMRNCRFDQEMLNSEFKVVIQELKRRRDNYAVTLASEILSAVFVDHPYHFPIIGFKQDLWNVYSEDLHAFYKKHYVPNNAALVVVGNVAPEEVFAAAEQEFGFISSDPSYSKEQFYRNDEMVSHGVTIYRDVQLPRVMVTYLVPGYATRDEYVAQALLALLGDGKSSRLYRQLVDELQIANWVSCFMWHLHDHDVGYPL